MENKLFVKSRPNQIALNSNATKLAVIDLNSTLTLLVINNDGGTLENFEKKMYGMLNGQRIILTNL